jgi:ATP-dependent helicase/DNAse subunit B
LIGVIFGEKGTGKTKRILNLANKTAKEAKGSIVFIDDDNRYMYDLCSSIRFINATEYDICTPKMLYGFLCGLSAQDFDLEYIFIDGFLSFTHHDIRTLEGLFEAMEKHGDRHNVNIILSVNDNANGIPPFIEKWLLPAA